MIRLQTLSVVYRALQDTPEPKTTAALAAGLDLTESRVADALECLERRGRVERAGSGYRAEPSRWGRLEPAVRFLAWLPRRVLGPFRRIAANV